MAEGVTPPPSPVSDIERGFYHDLFFANNLGPRRPRFPAIDCAVCHKEKLAAVGNQNWCVLCSHFKVIVPVLVTSTYCCCKCNCDEPVEGDVSDDDYIPEEHSSVGSSSTDSEADAEITVEETTDLRMVLSEWEIRDLRVQGYDETLLRRAFREIYHVYAQQRQPTLPEWPDCTRCKKRYVFVLKIAILEDKVAKCEACKRPRLAKDKEQEVNITLDQPQLCSCRCKCLDKFRAQQQIDPSDVQPIYKPFVPSYSFAHPSPWVRRILEIQGFCVRDRAAEKEAWRQILPTEPTLSEVIDDNYPEPEKDYLAENRAYGDGYNIHTHFPNGMERSAQTESGLPLRMENNFRRTDPDVFGKATRDKYRSEVWLQQQWFSNEEEAADNRRMADLMHEYRNLQPTQSSRCVMVEFFITENERRLLPEDDYQSICTVDEPDFPAELTAEEYLDDINETPRGQMDHNVRHLVRRYERLMEVVGWGPVDSEILSTIARRVCSGRYDV